MPYRTELRRPDLKGTFRCSLCNKIFCHSSSLSRHRMQAHFKSYTCTLCNKEITSNETLRAHMYKKHQISRMFMCRCCNWAFPDKTSLHIHMQAMATGNPGNVSIIAKSSSSPGAFKQEFGDDGSSAGSDTQQHQPPGEIASPSAISSIFPPLGVRDDMMNRLRERALFGNFASPVPTTGPGLDLASLFPNFHKLNPAAVLAFSRYANGLDLSSGQKEGAKNNLDDAHNGTADEEDADGAMADIEYGDSLYGSDDTFEHETSSRVSPPRTADLALTTADTKSSSSLDDDDEASPAPKKARLDQHSALAGVEIDVKSAAAATPTVHASPLNSLMYHKKLSNALRNKRPAAVESSAPAAAGATSFLDNLLHQKFPAGAAAFFNNPAAAPVTYASPLLSLHQQLQRQQQHLMAGAPAAAVFGTNKDALVASLSRLAPAVNGVKPVPSSTANHFQHIMNQLAHMSDDRNSSTTNSHVSPTDTASTKSSGSKAQCDMEPRAPEFEAMPCFQCQVLRGRLAQCENRARFLESRTTSQESKISRLDCRVSTLEANNRRYETEAVALRDHCESLERKILDCQERVLKYLTSNDYDVDTTRRLLQDVLETCRVYGSALLDAK